MTSYLIISFSSFEHACFLILSFDGEIKIQSEYVLLLFKWAYLVEEEFCKSDTFLFDFYDLHLCLQNSEQQSRCTTGVWINLRVNKYVLRAGEIYACWRVLPVMVRLAINVGRTYDVSSYLNLSTSQPLTL